jgi:hypothetical protein
LHQLPSEIGVGGVIVVKIKINELFQLARSLPLTILKKKDVQVHKLTQEAFLVQERIIKKMKIFSNVGVQMKQEWFSYIARLVTLKENTISGQTHFPNTGKRQN